MIAKNRLPGWYDADQNFHVNARTAVLIQNHNGKLVNFEKMPTEAQLALIQYMAIDGEAWDISPSLNKVMGKHIRLLSGRTNSDKAVKAWGDTLKKHLPFYIERYGKEQFGYIEQVPVMVLIESCMKDREMQQDYPGVEGWKKYHDQYMKSGTTHTAPGDKPWPVILGSFDDETLQDGWNRFNQYAEQRRDTCPAIFYPRQIKNELMRA